MAAKFNFDEKNRTVFSVKKNYRLSKSLDEDQIDKIADNLVETKEVFHQFNCQSLRKYHELYVLCDKLLPAFVFKEFRSISYEAYGLDCAHHFTVSYLADDSFKHVCKADKEGADRDHLDMVENMMWDRTASVFEKWQFTANNGQLNETFNASEDTKYGFMIDVN